MIIESPAFRCGEAIPTRFTCFGDNCSPPLMFRDVPRAARSLVLLMEQLHTERDAFTLWVLFNLPPTTAALEEGGALPPGARSGRNHWNRTGYHGPQFEGEHTYVFRLFALDSELDLPEGTDVAHLLDAMGGHLLAKAEMWGRYDPPVESQPATAAVGSKASGRLPEGPL